MSLEDTEAASAAVQKTPNRVSLDHLKQQIAGEHYFTLGQAFSALDLPVSGPAHSTFMICVLTMRNGFIVIGKTAPADPANFKEEVGRKFAYEDAMRQLWPLEGYLLRHRLSGQST